MEWTRGPIIGRGSTATVWLASSVFSGEIFALKSVDLSNSLLLRKEQSILSQLSSPYIVKYIGFCIRDENCDMATYNLCMEYVPGGTLQEVIKRSGGQLDEPVIRAYTRDILRGLDYLHVTGLIHCDVKSQNVLIHKDGAKIADFGCARYVEDNGSFTSAFSGTPAFMAPEVARGEEQEFPADVWAVGCTILEMATGFNPWSELSDPVSALYKIGFSNEVPDFPGWFSDQGKDFLSKCLCRDPKERWNIKELLEHPFLDESEVQYYSKEVGEFTRSNSPSCVLDHGFWDSMDSLESPDGGGCSNSPAERMRRLTGSSMSIVSNVSSWTWEDDWITVRSSEIEESNKSFDDNGGTIVLANESSVSLIVNEQEPESSLRLEDLSLELCVENSRDTDDYVNDGSLEDYFVPQNLLSSFSSSRIRLQLTFHPPDL
ncbi:hypothetical protein K2173_015385 [Erythroxylum novogranatense]|uniref:Protein kinase domain-containing protein n=1 Tax=Erythroxylum novogranatense TaxID=1862640 RepID=A0AAV8SRL7_9ROSI|nr:hypothetical protein K2173_015385 [Erythroxylum novogranatense]